MRFPSEGLDAMAAVQCCLIAKWRCSCNRNYVRWSARFGLLLRPMLRWVALCLAGIVVSTVPGGAAGVVDEGEIPVIALLIDGREIRDKDDRVRLHKLAAELPYTPNLVVCVLQDTWCAPPVPARNSADRINSIHKVIASVSQRAGNSDDEPRTVDVSRVLNQYVSRAFNDFWNNAGPVQRDESDQQVWIVLVSTTIYFDVGNSPLQYSFHNARLPEICLQARREPARWDRMAKVHLVIAIPNAAYPDSGINQLAAIVRDAGGWKLEGIYQVALNCPSRTENLRNWMGRSAVRLTGSSCNVRRGVDWAGGISESLGCRPAGQPSRPSLLEQVRTALSSQQRSAPSGSFVAPSPPAPSPIFGPSRQGVTKKSIPPNQTRPGPGPKGKHAAAANSGGSVTKPPPVVGVPGGATPLSSPRSGPDPRTVTAPADARPAAVVAGILMRRPVRSAVRTKPVELEFNGTSGAFELELSLVGPVPGTAPVTGHAPRNRLVVPARPSRGDYRIMIVLRAHDPRCTAGRKIRGAVTAAGSAAVPVKIAIELEVLRCSIEPVSVAIGKLKVR